MTRPWKTMAWTLPLVLLAACTDRAKEPAEAAMAAAGAAVESLKGDAKRLMPDEVKKLESSLEVGKASMANKDYAGALTFTKDIPARAKELIAKADAAKAELAKAWTESSDGITRSIEAAKHRLSGSRKPPPGLDPAALAKANADLASIQSGWAAASTQYQSGDWSGAVAQARSLDARGVELLRDLGMKK